MSETVENHGCSNGQVFNITTRKLEPCPECKLIRQEEVRENTAKDTGQRLEDLLGFEGRLLNSELEMASIIPEVERPFLEQESLEFVEEQVDKVFGCLVRGEAPSESVCFGLGIKGKFDRLVFPMMIRAYRQGLKVHRFLSVLEYNRLVQQEDPEVSDIINADVVFLLINEGLSNAEISAAKGLMQIRGIRGKATIFVTTWLIQACSALLGTVGESELILAKPVFVEYRRKEGEKKESGYIERLKGVENKSALGDLSSPAPKINFGDL